MLHCKFSGDYNSERIFKIGQYLTKRVRAFGVHFFGPPCRPHGLENVFQPQVVYVYLVSGASLAPPDPAGWLGLKRGAFTCVG